MILSCSKQSFELSFWSWKHSISDAINESFMARACLTETFKSFALRSNYLVADKSANWFWLNPGAFQFLKYNQRELSANHRPGLEAPLDFSAEFPSQMIKGNRETFDSLTRHSSDPQTRLFTGSFIIRDVWLLVDCTTDRDEFFTRPTNRPDTPLIYFVRPSADSDYCHSLILTRLTYPRLVSLENKSALFLFLYLWYFYNA